MGWTNQLVLEFLEYYEEKELIWNPRNKQHKDRNAVHNAWKEIEAKLGGRYSIKELKKKKDALMATFRKLNAKARGSTKRGSGSDDEFKPYWFAYEKMVKFLHAIYSPRRTLSSEKMENEMMNTKCEVIFTEDDESSHYNDDDDEAIDDIEAAEYDSTSSEQLQNSNANFKTPTAALNDSKKRKIETPAVVVEQRMDEAYNILKQITENLEQDECSLYAALLAKKLRAFDESTRQMAMHEIDNFVYGLRQQMNNSSYPTHSGLPFSGYTPGLLPGVSPSPQQTSPPLSSALHAQLPSVFSQSTPDSPGIFPTPSHSEQTLMTIAKTEQSPRFSPSPDS